MKKWNAVWLRWSSVFVVVGMFFIISCGGDGGEPEPTPNPPEEEDETITVNPASVKQEMVGFGGALTWYSNWMMYNDDREHLADLMFDDLGIDIVRFKNWYYPEGYPANKSTANMPDDNATTMWGTTNDLYDMAMERNPDIRILLSSWGPPKELKSNNLLPQGTLKKDGGVFMYDAFATYWEDVLDNVPFDPDYISIQNEPTYINAGWTTCQWAVTETAALPSYMTAFDKVYDKIKNREHVPIMLGPESQDIPTFVSFATALKDKPSCGAYGFHPYNINSATAAGAINTGLQSVGNFNTKPIIMTEFSDNLNWYNTALFIQNSLTYGNIAGYIYWKLVWDTPATGEDAGMISINAPSATSDYEVTPFYYLIKHYSKHIDAGYHRVEVTSPDAAVLTTAFLSPDSKKLTLVIINNATITKEFDVEVTGKTINTITADQSKQGSYYKPVVVASPTSVVSLPTKSITTVVLNLQ